MVPEKFWVWVCRRIRGGRVLCSRIVRTGLSGLTLLCKSWTMLPPELVWLLDSSFCSSRFLQFQLGPSGLCLRLVVHANCQSQRLAFAATYTGSTFDRLAVSVWA